MINKIEEIINRSSLPKKEDNFYVEFYGFPSNIGNFLGRQVVSIDRPGIRFEDIRKNYKSSEYRDIGRVRYDSISITFSNDEESLTSMMLYAQVMRQKGIDVSDLQELFGDEFVSSKRFGLTLRAFNSKGEETEGYKLQDCFISEISHNQQVTTGEQDSTITVTIKTDNIYIKVFDRFLQMREGST